MQPLRAWAPAAQEPDPLPKLLQRSRVCMDMMERISGGGQTPTHTLKLAWDSDAHAFLPAVSLQKLAA